MPDTNFVWTDELVERAIIWCLQYKELLNMEMMKDEFAKDFDKKEVKEYYEIISVRERNNKDNIIECKYRGMFNPDYYEIHSVKRLSDNEVFTIGDKLKKMSKENIIVSIWQTFNDNDIWLSTNDKLQYGCSLDVAEHIKPKSEELIEVKLTKSELYKLIQIING